MSPDAVRIIHAALGEQPPDDRLAVLIGCIVERHPEAMHALVSMAAAIAAMAYHLDARDRIVPAEILRDTADHVERRRATVRVD